MKKIFGEKRPEARKTGWRPEPGWWPQKWRPVEMDFEKNEEVGGGEGEGVVNNYSGFKQGVIYSKKPGSQNRNGLCQAR